MTQNFFEIWGKYLDPSSMGSPSMENMTEWMNSITDMMGEWTSLSRKIMPQPFFSPDQFHTMFSGIPAPVFPFQPDLVWKAFGIITEKEHKELVIKYEEILKKIEAEKNKNKNQEKTIQNQKKDLKDKGGEIEKLSEETESYKKELKTRDSEIKKIIKEIEALKKDLETRDTEIEMYTQEVDSLEKQVREQDQAMKTKEDEIEKLAKEIEARKKEIENLSKAAEKPTA